MLIRCSVRDAEDVRDRAFAERRTLSGYLLNILMRQLQIDERLASNMTPDLKLTRPDSTPPAKKSSEPRTALLLRCSVQEASRIRAGAQRRGTTINGYVLHALSVTRKVVPPPARN